MITLPAGMPRGWQNLPFSRLFGRPRAAGDDSFRTTRRVCRRHTYATQKKRSALTSSATVSRFGSTEQIHRKFHAAVIDEADSILIDEARVPLVIAGGEWGDRGLASSRIKLPGRPSSGEHFTVDPGGHNVALSDAGIHAGRALLGRGSLFEEQEPADSRDGSRGRSTRTPCCIATSTNSSKTGPSR